MANILKSKHPNAKIVDGTSFPDFVLKHIEEFREKTALISPADNRSYTYSDIISISRHVAVSLHDLGVRRGDVVATCTTNNIDVIPFMLGVQLLGASVNTANPAYTVRELIVQFKNSRPSFVLTTSDFVEKISRVRAECSFLQKAITLDKPVDDCIYLRDLIEKGQQRRDFTFPHINACEDVAFLFNSSGTTGLPKAVMLSHFNVVSNLCQVIPRYLEKPYGGLYAFAASDIVLSVFPMFHVGGVMIATFWALCNGATSIVFDRYDPANFKAVKAYKVTVLGLPPPVLNYLIKSPDIDAESFRSVKTIMCGAAVVTKSITEGLFQKFPIQNVIQVYGMTELSPFCHVTPLLPQTKNKSGSCGMLIPSTECKVIDVDTGRALEAGKHGEICIRGPQVMKGYLNNDAATKETVEPDGWLHTGDVGYYDQDEYFFVVDRIKELIKVKGFQVAPAELEEILLSHNAVAEAAVIGVHDADAGELPRAYIILKPNAHVSEDEIKRFVADRVVSYKRLHGGVTFVKELPKTESGKLLRRVLRDQAKNGQRGSKL